MQFISKALVASGLVILTGPLCFMAQAQDYIDVEAERQAQSRAVAPADPYGARPAQSYPATSYGVNSAPAGSPVSPGAAVGGSAQNQGQNLGNLFYQIQQLQQEVMRLNGKVEEQAHELRTLKEQSLQRYMDLDKRVSGSAGAAATTAAATTATAAAATSAEPAVRTASSVKEQPGEGDAYRAAYALVRGQQFDSAVRAFNQFLRNYPDGKYAANAHYWLGELYLVVEPQDLESSRQSFMLLLSQYPDNSKAPDAMYKLGKVYFLKGNRQKAREYFDRVISEYASSNSSAVKLSRDFIAENY
tara:strand:- start:1531 stop:2436 length:906 start_codon:yes stop_codon:yes gene_type:complete